MEDPEGKPFGVAAMDIDTSFLPSVLNTQTIEGVQDFFLTNTPEKYILFGEKEAPMKNISNYL